MESKSKSFKSCLFLLSFFRCRAELQYLKENRFHQATTDPEEQKFLVREEQKKQIEQLEENLVYLRAKRDEYIADIEKEETLHENLIQINKSLKVRYQTVIYA